MADAKKTITCQRCGTDTFGSRNQLFAHLKICLLDRNPDGVEPVSDEAFFAQRDGYLYVTGGRIRGKTLGAVERFNIVSKTWEKLSSLRENRGSHGSASVGERLYIVGGGGFRSNLSTTECLDCRTGEWANLAELPVSRHALYAFSVGRSIYAVGGWVNGSIGSTDLERYDIDTDSWTVLAPMPTGRRLLGATEYQNRIYTFGGNLGDREWNSDAVEIYDIGSNSWAKGPSLPVAGQASAVTIGDYIYVVMHGHYILRCCPRTLTYTQVSFGLPHPRWFCFDVAAVNHSIFIAGGNIDGVWSNVLWKYNVLTNEWEELPRMTKDRRRCSVAVVYMDKAPSTTSPV